MEALTGRVAVVTGANGIGKGIASVLGEEGATIHVTGRTVESGAAPLPGTIGETVAEVDRRGVSALPIQRGRRKISAPHRTAPHRASRYSLTARRVAGRSVPAG